MCSGYDDQMLEAKAVKMSNDLTRFLPNTKTLNPNNKDVKHITKTPTLKPLMQINKPRKRERNGNGDKPTCFPVHYD